MDCLSNYSARLRRPTIGSVHTCGLSVVTLLAAVVLTGLAWPQSALADRGFFADDGSPYWRSESGLTGGRTRSGAVTVAAPRLRTQRTAAAPITAVAVDDVDDGVRPQARRATPSRPAVKRAPAAARRTATRPRLTPGPTAQRASRTRLASLGAPATFGPPAPSALPSLSGGLVAWRASSSCLASNLRNVIERVASYGPVTVNSTCRSRAHNRRVGGASRSWHLTGNAADLRVRGNWRAAMAYLRGSVGGFKHYGGGLFHIDNGPKRRF